MLPAATIGVLTRRFQQTTKSLSETIGGQLQKAWLNLPGYDEANVAEFARLARPIEQAAKARSVSLANGYYSFLAQVPAPAVKPGAVATVLDTRKPFITHWRALKMGNSWQDALTAGSDGAASSASDFVVSTARRTADEVYRSTGTRVAGWRRALDGGACPWCQLVADQRYESAESADFGHDHCHCSAIPIIGDSDPGQVFNDAA